MKNIGSFKFPDELAHKLEKARKLELITIGYLLSVVVVMYLVMGSSQAMKTAWLEDALGMLPAISFLIAYKFFNKKPTLTFPYGFHRIFGIANLTGALALFLMGCYLLVDSSISLITVEKPSIGSLFIFNHQIWLGWIMLIALIYSSVPAMILGHKKLPLAKKLHNKILHTDAQTQKADWTTAFAAMLGIVGVGLGFWWADSAAALFISFSVLKDGFSGLKDAVLELMDRRPVTVNKEKDPLVKKIASFVENEPSIKKAGVRFREHGQSYFAEVLIVSNANENIDLEKLREKVINYHWKIYDVSVMEVSKIPDYFLTPSSSSD